MSSNAIQLDIAAYEGTKQNVKRWSIFGSQTVFEYLSHKQKQTTSIDQFLQHVIKIG